MKLGDLTKTAAVLAGVATVGAGALALGLLALSRDRERLQRVLGLAAGLVERGSFTLASAQETLADAWADARERARREVEREASGDAAEEGGAGDDETPARE